MQIYLFSRNLNTKIVFCLLKSYLWGHLELTPTKLMLYEAIAKGLNLDVFSLIKAKKRALKKSELLVFKK